MSHEDAIRALLAEMELLPEDKRKAYGADLTDHVNCLTRHLQEQRELRERRKR